MKIKVPVILLAFILAPVLASYSYGGLFSSKTNSGLVRIFESLDVNGPDDNTVRELEDYVDRNPKGESVDEALLRLGRIYADKKDFRKAEIAYQKIIEDFPASRFKLDSMYELGYIWYRDGRLKDAKLILDPVSADSSATVSLRVKASRLLKDINSLSFDAGPEGGAGGLGGRLLERFFL